jgi:peptidoglycan/LPS O-acetylase OafA/YrhL
MSWAWSLSVEEHFYAFLPPLLFLVYRVPRRSLRPVLIALVGGAPLVGRALQYLNDPSIELMKGFYYYSHNRFDEVFVGVMIAWFYVTKREAFRAFAERNRHVLWVAGVACVGIVWVFGGLQKNGAFAIVAQFSLMALGAGFLVINCLFLDNAVTRFFAHRLWYPLARISYGTYLIHPFVLFGFLALHLRDAPLTEIQPWDVIGFFVLVLVVTTLLAGAMFVVLEAPLLRVGMRMSARSRARAGARDARAS